MTAALTLACALVLGPCDVEEGSFSQYAQGPTDSQIWYHTEVTGLLPPNAHYDSYIAMISCEHVGKTAWIQVEPYSEWRRSFVFDCSGHATTTRNFKRRGIIAELDYYTVMELGIEGRGVKGQLTFRFPYHWRSYGAGYPVPY